jgi:hypothetical protein
VVSTRLPVNSVLCRESYLRKIGNTRFSIRWSRNNLQNNYLFLQAHWLQHLLMYRPRSDAAQMSMDIRLTWFAAKVSKSFQKTANARIRRCLTRSSPLCICNIANENRCHARRMTHGNLLIEPHPPMVNGKSSGFCDLPSSLIQDELAAARLILGFIHHPGPLSHQK